MDRTPYETPAASVVSMGQTASIPAVAAPESESVATMATTVPAAARRDATTQAAAAATSHGPAPSIPAVATCLASADCQTTPSNATATATASDASAGAARPSEALAPGATAASEGTASSAGQAAAAAPQDGQARVFEVNVRTVDGNDVRLEVPADVCARVIKERIHEQLGLPVDGQRLIFRGRVVADEDIVGSLITENGQTMHVVQRPPPSSNVPSAPRSGPPDAPRIGGDIPINLPGANLADGTGTAPPDLAQLLSTIFGSLTPQPPGPPPGPPPRAPPPPPLHSGDNGLRPPPPVPDGVLPGFPGNPIHRAGFISSREAGVSVSLGGDVQMQPVHIFLQRGHSGRGLPHAEAARIAERLRRTGSVNRATSADANLVRDNSAHHAAVSAAARAAGAAGASGAGGEGRAPLNLPWNDLRRLRSQLRRALGLNSPPNSLPPSNMRSDMELYTYLTALMASTNQIGVAIGEMQASLIDGTPEARSNQMRQQLAAVLHTAARSLRVSASALRNSCGEYNGEVLMDPAAEAEGDEAARNAGYVRMTGTSSTGERAQAARPISRTFAQAASSSSAPAGSSADAAPPSIAASLLGDGGILDTAPPGMASVDMLASIEAAASAAVSAAGNEFDTAHGDISLRVPAEISAAWQHWGTTADAVAPGAEVPPQFLNDGDIYAGNGGGLLYAPDHLPTGRN